MNNNEDKGSFGWSILGFFFPLVGLVLFLVWISNKKSSAKYVGIGALVGFICRILFSIILGLSVFMLIFRTVLGEVTTIDDECSIKYGERYESVYVDGIWYCKNLDTNEMILKNGKMEKQYIDNNNTKVDYTDKDLLKEVDVKATYGVLVNNKISNFDKLDYSNNKEFTYDKVEVSVQDDNVVIKGALDDIKKEQSFEAKNVVSVAIDCNCGGCNRVVYLNNEHQLYEVELDHGALITNDDGTLNNKYVKLLNNNVEGFTLVDVDVYSETTCGGFGIAYKDITGKKYMIDYDDYNSENPVLIKVPLNQFQRKYIGSISSEYYDFYAVNNKNLVKNLLKDEKGADLIASKVFMQDNSDGLRVYVVGNDNYLYTFKIDKSNNLQGKRLSNLKAIKFGKTEANDKEEYAIEFEDKSKIIIEAELTY